MAQIEQRNKRVMLVLLCVVAGMIAMAYASVPLYNLFCRVTGYGGTTERVEANRNHAVVDRPVTVRFNTSMAPDMPWSFRPEVPSMDLKLGEDGFVSFRAYNPSDKPITGTALFNVTPAKAGQYFKKIQCFCFDEQTLGPGKAVNMPVQFYVDPAMAEDPFLDDVKTITLSYTFFRADSQTLEDAYDTFYNEPNGTQAKGRMSEKTTGSEEKVLN